MPRVKNVYECSRCSNLMPNTERVPVTVKLRGPLKVQYKEDLCLPCAKENIRGKDTRELPTPAPRATGGGTRSNPGPPPRADSTS